MVIEYFNLAGHGSVSRQGLLVGSGSFLRLGASHQPADDYEMAANSSEENGGGSLSPNSGFFSSTMTSLSDDRNSGDSMEKKNHLGGGDLSNSLNSSIAIEANQSPSTCPDTPTSRKGSVVQDDKKDPNFSGKDEENETNIGSIKFGQAFLAPLGNMNLEAEQSVVQQQIVDMYMRSMQQFTESLAKMKLPMDLDHKPESVDHGDVIQNHNSHVELEKKKDSSRVFYGSRAFF